MMTIVEAERARCFALQVGFLATAQGDWGGLAKRQ
jgi:hypothetical protein